MSKKRIGTPPGDIGFSTSLSGIRFKDIIFPVIAVLAGVAGNLLFTYFPNIYEFLSSFLSQFWINLLGIFVIGILGSLLYLLRERRRILYGIIEISFSLAYGWYAINKVSSVGYIEAISVIASVYLVVRGIDNIMEGRKKQLEQAFIEDAKQIQSVTKNELPTTP